jgi:hypothetical protein
MSSLRNRETVPCPLNKINVLEPLDFGKMLPAVVLEAITTKSHTLHRISKGHQMKISVLQAERFAAASQQVWKLAIVNCLSGKTWE